MTDEMEDERVRAEDILLGTHGFGEDARLLELYVTKDGYRGRGVWADGEAFEFCSDEAPGELECWAIEVLVAQEKTFRRNQIKQ